MPELTLRERKYAATKAAIMEAVIVRLDTQSLDEIAVKDVCNDVQISETTFFNYFPTKQDVIVYFVQIWSIAVAWQMQQTLRNGGTHLDAVRSMFDFTAQQGEDTSGVMNEVIAYQAQGGKGAFTFTPLTPAEYAQHFPQHPGIETMQARDIDQLMVEQLIAAQQSAELPADTDVEALSMTLIAVFFITPVIMALGHGGDTATVYRRQLDLLLPGSRKL